MIIKIPERSLNLVLSKTHKIITPVKSFTYHNGTFEFDTIDGAEEIVFGPTDRLLCGVCGLRNCLFVNDERKTCIKCLQEGR